MCIYIFVTKGYENIVPENGIVCDIVTSSTLRDYKTMNACVQLKL